MLGPHFERLAREHVRRTGKALVGAPIVTVGTTVVNDRDDRAAHELDIVALAPGTGRQHRTIRAIGEAKLRALDTGDLARLMRIRTVLHGAEDAHLILVSASGFAAGLESEAAARADVHLVSLEDVYGNDEE